MAGPKTTTTRAAPATRTRSTAAKRGNSSPFTELGVGGTAVSSGIIVSQERSPKLRGANRWKTAQDLLVNLSMVAAGVRYYLNLLARPAWKLDPPNDSDEAKAVAEFFDSVINDTDTSWKRIVRRDGMFKYHGFGLSEWLAKRRLDGKIGLASIERRPQPTISRWDVDGAGSVLGVWQRPPQGGQEIYLPRGKLVYLVDDVLTDSPEGMGWSRHLVEPGNRLRAYLKQEGVGFERDLSGIPVGRAPITAINAAVKAGTMTRAEGDALIDGLSKFVSLKAKEPGTSIVVDSQPWTTENGQGGKTVSDKPQWDVSLLTGKAESIEALGEAIARETYDIALVIGVERMLIGREGAGALALGEDTSRNLFLNINSTLGDQAESYDRDVIKPVGALNGIPDDLMPTLKVEDASYRDVEQIARILADMATAGAVLQPDDPAINEVRDLTALPHQPDPQAMMDRQAAATAAATAALGGKTGGKPLPTPPGIDPEARPTE